MENDTIDFIKGRSVGIVATCDEGKPHAVPVYYYFNEKEEIIYFVTKDKTKKYSNIEKNKNVSFTIFSEDPQTVFNAECEAELLSYDDDGYMEITNQLIDVHANQGSSPTPISLIRDGSLKLVKLKIKYNNFTLYQKES